MRNGSECLFSSASKSSGRFGGEHHFERGLKVQAVHCLCVGEKKEEDMGMRDTTTTTTGNHISIIVIRALSPFTRDSYFFGMHSPAVFLSLCLTADLLIPDAGVVVVSGV